MVRTDGVRTAGSGLLAAGAVMAAVVLWAGSMEPEGERGELDLAAFERGVDGTLRLASLVDRPAPTVDARDEIDRSVDVVHRLTHRLALGVAAPVDVARVVDAVLAPLADVTPRELDDAARWVLVDDPRLHASLSRRADELVFDVDAASEPGDVTGLAGDGAERVGVEIVLGSRGGRHVSAQALAAWRPSRDLASRLGERARPLGGRLTIRDDRSTWQQLALGVGDCGGVAVSSRAPLPARGDLDDPAVEALCERLARLLTPAPGLFTTVARTR